MTWHNHDFAEGDSGVPMPGHYVAIWKGIEDDMQNPAKEPTLVRQDPILFLANLAGELLAIGRNKQNDPLARATALSGAHRVIMDQSKLLEIYGDTTNG